jgi:HEAT repeat protein
MGLMIFYGIVLLLPLFFLYLIYGDMAKKRGRRRQFTQPFRPPDSANGSLKDAEKLIGDLDSLFPWVRIGAINNLVKNDSQGVRTIITALDLLPYYESFPGGYVVLQPDFADILHNVHPVLIKALARIGRSSVEKLNDALQHPNLNVRLSAISALGKINDPLAVELLVQLADSPDLGERRSAIAALGELRATSATEKIISSLRDSDAAVRELGVRALIKINDIKSLPALEYLANTDGTIVEAGPGRPTLTLGQLAADAVVKIRKANSH